MAENESPFEEWLLPHLDGAYNFARWLVDNDQDAQAIVGEAYVQAMRHFAEVGETGARVWLLTIVRKTADTWLERGNRSTFIPFEEGTHKGPSTTAKPMAGKSDKTLREGPDQERKEAFYEALKNLPIELGGNFGIARNRRVDLRPISFCAGSAARHGVEPIELGATKPSPGTRAS